MGVTVGVNLKSIAMMNPGSRDPRQKPTRKSRATLLDLPLPRDGRHLQNWRKNFVSPLITWAGSQVDPFGTNGLLDGTVPSLWKRAYPDIGISDKDMKIVIAVVCLFSQMIFKLSC